MSYPNSIKQFVTKIDKNASGWFIGPEYFNIPAATPFYLYLDHVPHVSATTHIGASGGANWTEIFTGTPTAGQYLVDYDYGKVTFAATNAGAAMQATYYNLGDDIMAEHVNSLQDEVVIVESFLGAGASNGLPTLKARLDAMDTTISASGINGQRITDNTVRAGALKDDIKGATWVLSGKPVLTDIVSHKASTLDAHTAGAISSTVPGTNILSVQDHINQKGTGTRTNLNPHGLTFADMSGVLTIDELDVRYVISSPMITGEFIGASGNTIAINTDGPDGDQYLSFYQDNTVGGANLKWNDSGSKFEFSDSIDVLGNISASGNIYPIGINGASPSGTRDIGSKHDPFASGCFDSIYGNGFKTREYTGATGQFTAGANTVTVVNGLIVSIV